MEKALQELAANIIPVLATFLTAVLTMGLRSLQKAYEKKLGAAMGQELQYELTELTHSAVNYAEEVAHKLAKSGKSAPSNEDKEQLAVDHLLSMASKHGLDEARAHRLVLAALGEMRRHRQP